MAGKGGKRSTSFKPGQSGNPKGRPKKLPPELEKAAKAHTAEAVEVLAKWMRSDNPAAAVSAADKLLSRAWGLPRQAIDANLSIGDELVKAMVAARERARRI